MNPKIIVAIVSAFLFGLLAGTFLLPNHNAPAGFLRNCAPFLLLLTLWIVLMAVKFTHRNSKC